MLHSLISVYNKEKIEDIARALIRSNVKIWASSGTFNYLKSKNFDCYLIDELTGFTEFLNGRVKTLHPSIFAGILAKRDNPDHLKQIEALDAPLFDFVIVNLYPFEKACLNKNFSEEELIEFIDIGGISLIRASAKNYKFVTTLCDINDYDEFIKKLENNEIDINYRKKLALKAFSISSSYDSFISSYFKEICNIKFPDILNLSLKKLKNLRYGENPHQKGTLYKINELKTINSIIDGEMHSGEKEFSMVNIIDAEASWNLVNEFDRPACVIVKHANPCGVAQSSNINESMVNIYIKAREADPISAFGSIVAFNRPIDIDTAREINKTFIELIIAPDISKEVSDILAKKKNKRWISMDDNCSRPKLSFVPIDGGMILQETDKIEPVEIWQIMSGEISDKIKDDLLFAWKVCCYVKSNAIVIARDGVTSGIGAGQPNRVTSVEIAIKNAKGKTKDAVLASDGFFPFKDSVELAFNAGIKTIIEPGGSVNDNEIINFCKEKGLNLIFTNKRHFKH